MVARAGGRLKQKDQEFKVSLQLRTKFEASLSYTRPVAK